MQSMKTGGHRTLTAPPNNGEPKTLPDAKDAEPMRVEYIARPESTLDVSPNEWAGEFAPPNSTEEADAGRRVLALDDGTLVDIEFESLGAGEGDVRTVE